MEEQNIKVESLLNNDKYNGPIIEFFQQFPEARFGIIVSIISYFERWETRSRRGGKAAATPLSRARPWGHPGESATSRWRRRPAATSRTSALEPTRTEVIIACGYVE